MTTKRQIDPADIVPLDRYAAARQTLRQQVVAVKRSRRLAIGPYATLHFESYQTMLWQVQEMLYIEKGGADQLRDELAAYNPLVPNGHELTATIMFEIDDPIRRKIFLDRIGGIEHTVYMDIGGDVIKAVPEGDTDRTNEAGKASSVHFFHFPFTKAQIGKFRTPEQRIIVGFSHPDYAHMAQLPEPMRVVLADDFD